VRGDPVRLGIIGLVAIGSEMLRVASADPEVAVAVARSSGLRPRRRDRHADAESDLLAGARRIRLLIRWPMSPPRLGGVVVCKRGPSIRSPLRPAQPPRWRAGDVAAAEFGGICRGRGQRVGRLDQEAVRGGDRAVRHTPDPSRTSVRLLAFVAGQSPVRRADTCCLRSFVAGVSFTR
jgi:hypothetical protein